MSLRKLICAALILVIAVAGTAVAAKGPAPKRAVIKAVQTLNVKVNRYIKDNLRWQKDVYTVRSGGTLRLVNDAPGDGPHTLTIFARRDLPRTPRQILGNCKICNVLGKAHGADPNSGGPPKFPFLENGTGQNSAPNFDRPGDSAFVDAKQGASVNLPVTAKKGTTLRFVCLIHPWMQGRILVK